MLKLTLEDIALRWFKTKEPTWLTEDQMKQAFLKRFNPWGDTRHQQQDAWNQLKFDMTKDDVDAFIVNMKMLASILGHNDEITMEKFKDIFQDPNIEATLIAMDDFAAMQAKAKQLVQIYKPTHSSPMASVALLTHTFDDTNSKNTPAQPKSNQHQLAPINPPQQQNSRGDGEYGGNYRGHGRGRNRGLQVEGREETPKTEKTKTTEQEKENINKGIMIMEHEVKKILPEGVKRIGTVTIMITVTEIIGIRVQMVKVTAENENGMEIDFKVTVMGMGT